MERQHNGDSHFDGVAMALRRCRECGGQVSSRAKACPQCGAPVKRKAHPIVGALAFLLVVAVCAGICTQAFKVEDKPARQKHHEIDGIAVEGFDDYTVRVEADAAAPELTLCQVTFNTLPRTSDIAAAVVRNAVEQLVEDNGSREILGMAFNLSGDALPDTQYGGALLYSPTDGQIRRMDERSALQDVEVDEGPYSVRIKEGRTAKGITPQRSWYNVSIVFQDKPAAKEIRAAVLKQIDKLKSRGLDIKLYVYRGDKSNRITWKQIKGPNGRFMAVDYVAATREVSPNWDWGTP
jgi:hypothetical protein